MMNEKKEKVINRNDIHDDLYREILDKEIHHDHEIVVIDGVFRWKEYPNNITEDIWEFIDNCNYDKNSEKYRKYYRDLGYSLSGYWEVFYWEVNNPDADSYNPIKYIRKNKLNKILNK